MNPATRGNEGNANAPVLYIALAHAKERFGMTLPVRRGLPNSHQEPAANAGVALATGGLISLSLFPGVD